MSEHSPTPWMVQDSIIFNRDDTLCRQPNHPENGTNWTADAAFIVNAVNSHDALVKALDGLLGCGNAIITAIPAADDPQSQEAFDMYDDARKRARAVLASIKDRA